MYSYIPSDTRWTASYPDDSRSCGYTKLDNLCSWQDYGSQEISTTAACTDRTRWACTSLAYNPPRLAGNAFYNLLNTPMKIDELPKQVIRPIATHPPMEPQSMFGVDQDAVREIDEQVSESRNIKESFSCSQPSTMMPVTDYRHNIRECIKNMILLEDHLCHPEKRCRDCCQKHFLFLEGLAEEARTLDISRDMPVDLFDLPPFYRSVATEWASIDPASPTADEQYRAVMQKLRARRKAIQDRFFSANNGAGCTNGVCQNV